VWAHLNNDDPNDRGIAGVDQSSINLKSIEGENIGIRYMVGLYPMIYCQISSDGKVYRKAVCKILNPPN
jgi:hypothetical protein